MNLTIGDRVRPQHGCTSAGQIGKLTEITENGCTVEFDDGNTFWAYAEDMLERMCPLCPDWDERYPLENDFFGEPCQINGQACCETCYTVYQLTQHAPSEE